MNPSATPTVQDWRARAAALAIDGQAFIDGRYVAAASGETFDDVTPIDGRVIARVAATDRRTSSTPSPRHAGHSTAVPGRGSPRANASASCSDSPN